MKIIIGVDTQFVYHSMKSVDPDNTRFPFRKFQDFIAGDQDEVIEMFAPVIRFPTQSTASDDVASFVRLSKLELDPSKFVPSWSDDMERLIALAFEQQYRP